jgi:hypothetical protein
MIRPTVAAISTARMGEAAAGRSRQSGYDRMDLTWDRCSDGYALYVVGIDEVILHVVPDGRHEDMWRVRYLDGRVTDMLILDRAKDAAASLAVSMLNTRYAGRTVE